MATPAACSKVTVAGLRTRLVPDATAYTAKVPAPDPRTSSPTRRSCTFVPTAATVPATSEPRTPFGGLGSPVAMRAMYGIPVTPANPGVHRRCADTHQHVVVGDHRYPDVPEFQDVVGGAVYVLGDRLHAVSFLPVMSLSGSPRREGRRRFVRCSTCRSCLSVECVAAAGRPGGPFHHHERGRSTSSSAGSGLTPAARRESCGCPSSGVVAAPEPGSGLGRGHGIGGARVFCGCSN